MKDKKQKPAATEQPTPAQSAPDVENETPSEDAQNREPQNNGETEASLAQWQEALETAVRQRDEYLDSLRRTQADFQNFRRRNQTARADGYFDGICETMEALLPSVDNLERAIKAAEAQSENALLEGVKMTLSLLMESLQRFGLAEIPAEGEDFNPELHHAVLRAPGSPAGKVLEVLQKGYRVKDKIIRYAMVKVSVEE